MSVCVCSSVKFILVEKTVLYSQPEFCPPPAECRFPMVIKKKQAKFKTSSRFTCGPSCFSCSCVCGAGPIRRSRRTPTRTSTVCCCCWVWTFSCRCCCFGGGVPSPFDAGRTRRTIPRRSNRGCAFSSGETPVPGTATGYVWGRWVRASRTAGGGEPDSTSANRDGAAGGGFASATPV